MAQKSAEQQPAQQLFDLLKKDHRLAEKMMKQIETSAEEEREDLLMSLKETLTEHMLMEEKEFYPKLKKISAMQDKVQDALEEHSETKEYLSELEEMDVDDEEWITTFQSMKEGVLHHVQDEEKEIFPECQKHLDAKAFEDIAHKCMQMKEKSASHPASSRTAGSGSKTRKQAEVA